MDDLNVPVASKSKKGWKITGIIFIILTALMLVASGLFVWKYFDQKTELGDLRAKNEKITQENEELSAQVAVPKEPDEPLGAPTAQEVLDAMGNPPYLTVNNVKLGGQGGLGEVRNSSVAPYQIFSADIGSNDEVGGFAVVLFRHNDRSPWQFGTAGQGAEPCESAASNWHLIRALADVACYDRNDDRGPMTYGTYFGL